MTTLFIVHLNHTGKEKRIVKKVSKFEDAVDFVKSCHRNSQYLKSESFESFLVNDCLDDGVYVISENENHIKVMRIEKMLFEGYLYNSNYVMRKQVNEYEIIKSISGDL